jgi:hypothetical protein
MRKRSRVMCRRPRRCRRPFSIRPVPARCRNRPIGLSRQQRQAPFPEMSLPRQRLKACRKQRLARTDGHQSLERARSATRAAPQWFVQGQCLIPIITRRSGMVTVARGSGGGTAIGSARRPVRDGKAGFPAEKLWTTDESLALFATSRPKRGHLLKRPRGQTRLDATQTFAGPSRCDDASYTPGPKK